MSPTISLTGETAKITGQSCGSRKSGNIPARAPAGRTFARHHSHAKILKERERLITLWRSQGKSPGEVVALVVKGTVGHHATRLPE